MADFIIAGDNAKFGQPEIKLAVTPGMGGSQRLTRAIGKAKAMEMCLTGRMMGAEEAERSGLVARVVPAEPDPHDSVPVLHGTDPSTPAAELAISLVDPLIDCLIPLALEAAVRYAKEREAFGKP